MAKVQVGGVLVAAALLSGASAWADPQRTQARIHPKTGRLTEALVIEEGWHDFHRFDESKGRRVLGWVRWGRTFRAEVNPSWRLRQHRGDDLRAQVLVPRGAQVVAWQTQVPLTWPELDHHSALYYDAEEGGAVHLVVEPKAGALEVLKPDPQGEPTKPEEAAPQAQAEPATAAEAEASEEASEEDPWASAAPLTGFAQIMASDLSPRQAEDLLARLPSGFFSKVAGEQLEVERQLRQSGALANEEPLALRWARELNREFQRGSKQVPAAHGRPTAEVLRQRGEGALDTLAGGASVLMQRLQNGTASKDDQLELERLLETRDEIQRALEGLD